MHHLSGGGEKLPVMDRQYSECHRVKRFWWLEVGGLKIQSNAYMDMWFPEKKCLNLIYKMCRLQGLEGRVKVPSSNANLEIRQLRQLVQYGVQNRIHQKFLIMLFSPVIYIQARPFGLASMRACWLSERYPAGLSNWILCTFKNIN